VHSRYRALKANGNHYITRHYITLLDIISKCNGSLMHVVCFIRCSQDEKLIDLIRQANQVNQNVLVLMDARPYKVSIIGAILVCTSYIMCVFLGSSR
jgi:hypothetical protein